MMPTMVPSVPALDQDVPAVQGGVADVTESERRLAPYFARAEPR